ncbi:hypothetical protein Vafri_13152 [Volvox africanus]|uniref:BTB domain-containing protein n=1 Tax=Volvox africanus TaxID=51714 RepID=A0A8J4BBF7_9CHLO|nr:hypothetical protein Vafri_13152 [Volvox africanus]
MLHIQDADPDAFEQLLRHFYTGDLGFPPDLLRPVAELADRLLLPQVVHHVHRRLLAAVQPAGVVGDMIWAQQQGFVGLLAELKVIHTSRHIGAQAVPNCLPAPLPPCPPAPLCVDWGGRLDCIHARNPWM